MSYNNNNIKQRAIKIQEFVFNKNDERSMKTKVNEVSEIYCVSRDTVYNYIKESNS